MKTHLRHYATSLLLLVPAAVSLVALPSSALAQPATPEVRSLEVAADDGFEAGSRLTFTLIGTPRAKGMVRVRGLREAVALREVSRGVYVGYYTIKRSDRVEADADVRAILRSGKRSSVASYALSETMPAPRVVVVPPPVRAPEPPLRIERFGMAPFERLEPGAELRFGLEGPPGGTVIVDLPGVANDVALREVRAGHYEGSYTIRRSDSFNLNRPVVATLRLGDRVVTSNLALPPGLPAADNRPPNVVNMSPREGEIIPGGPPTQITANFDDRGGSGVDPASVQIIVSGRNVTSEAQINAQSFSLRSALPPGRHTVDVTARDRAGNVVRRSWSFDVAAAAPVNVPVQVLNHGHNDQVGSGPTLVQGRTGPNASVAVSVQAVAPIGGVVNISQNLFSQTLQADANGNFSFSFVPQFTIPGTRYDVVMVSSRGNASHETRLSLFQR